MGKLIYKFIVGLLVIINSQLSHAQTFQYAYGGNDNDYGHAAQQTTDGGYIIAGYTWSFGVSLNDVYLVKIDPSGNVTWSKTYGGISADFGHDMQQTTDGGYIIAGYTTSFGNGAEVYLIKTDASGNLTWSKTFGGNASDEGNSVIQTSDGGYIITGKTTSFGQGAGDVYLIKTNSTGNMQWSRTFGGVDADEGHCVIQTNDGGYMVCGRTESYGAGSSDVYLVKTNASGNLIWTRTYGGTGIEYGYSIQQTADGGYIVAGRTESFATGGLWDVYLIKTDDVGNPQWSKTYGGSGYDYGFDVQQTSDFGYVIAGRTESFGAGNGDTYLIKTSASGDTLWTKAYGGTATDFGRSVDETTDGGFIIGGDAFSFGAGAADYYLIKTDPQGNSGCNETGTSTIVDNAPTIMFAGSTPGFGGTENSPGTSSGNPATVETLLCFSCLSVSSISNQVSCYGACDGSDTLSPSGGLPPYTYLWSNGQTDSTATGLCAGTYSVTISDINNCSQIITVTITEPPPLNIGITGNSTLCPGDTITLTVSGGASYLWNTGGTNSSITVNPTSDTWYFVTITDGPCFNVDSVLISIIYQPTADIDGNASICLGEKTTLNVTGNGSYSWSTGGNGNNITVQPDTTTTYMVTVTNNCGIDNAFFEVKVAYPPVAYAGEDTTINIGESVRLSGSEGPLYSWTPVTTLGCNDCPNPVASPLNTTTYILLCTTNEGCQNSDTVTVYIDKTNNLQVPNVFTPNKDAINDEFYAKGFGLYYDKYTMYIFNRWGQIIFVGNDVDDHWDGTAKALGGNKIVPEGVYIWKIIIEYDEIYEERIGHVTLLR